MHASSRAVGSSVIDMPAQQNFDGSMGTVTYYLYELPDAGGGHEPKRTISLVMGTTNSNKTLWMDRLPPGLI